MIAILCSLLNKGWYKSYLFNFAIYTMEFGTSKYFNLMYFPASIEI